MPENSLVPSATEIDQILSLVKDNPDFFVHLFEQPATITTSPNFDAEEANLALEFSKLPLENLNADNIHNVLANNASATAVIFKNLGRYRLGLMIKKYNSLTKLNIQTRKELLKEIIFLSAIVDPRIYKDLDEKSSTQINKIITYLYNTYDKSLALETQGIKTNKEWFDRREAAMIMLLKMQTQSRVLDKKIFKNGLNILLTPTASSIAAGLDKKTLLMLMICDVALQDRLTKNAYISHFNTYAKKEATLIKCLNDIQGNIDNKMPLIKDMLNENKEKLQLIFDEYSKKLQEISIELAKCSTYEEVKSIFIKSKDFAFKFEVVDALQTKLNNLMGSSSNYADNADRIKYSKMTSDKLLAELKKHNGEEQNSLRKIIQKDLKSLKIKRIDALKEGGSSQRKGDPSSDVPRSSRKPRS